MVIYYGIPKVWTEYESAARWCAARGLAGQIGDPLPDGISAEASKMITDDIDAFKDHVRSCAEERAEWSERLSEGGF